MSHIKLNFLLAVIITFTIDAYILFEFDNSCLRSNICVVYSLSRICQRRSPRLNTQSILSYIPNEKKIKIPEQKQE